MKLQSTLLRLTAPLVLGGTLLAQGADLCANAQPVVGTGLFPFDNTTALTDGLPDTACFFFNLDNIDNDVWFSWQAPNDGAFSASTCGQTSIDTRIAIYDGSCAGLVLTCNDDSCGTLQTEVTWAALAGQTYVIRLGNYPGAAPGTGFFEITENLPFENTVNGHHYQLMPANGITWDQARLQAASMVFQGASGHLATLTEQSEHDFVFSIGDPHNYWVGGFQNTNSPNFVEPGGAWEWITGEPFVFTAWLPGEPNNTGATGAEDWLELLGAGGGFNPTWNDASQVEHPRGFVVEFPTGSGTAYCFGDGLGATCPCGNFGGTDEGCANSSGSGATLTSGGTNSAMLDDLTLQATGMLPGQSALLFSGTLNLGNGILFGDGLRCTGGPILRLGVKVPDSSGDASWGPGLASASGWSAGDTRSFQAWYRDNSGSPCGFNFNLSNGIEVVYVP